MNPLRILLIDPDPKNVRILRNNFLDLNFEVDAAANDAEALEKISAQAFDAILAEVSAPGIDGYAVLDQAQQSPLNRSCAVIFLTQKSDVWNRVKSFKLGAKDYIVKPIHVREIVGRVQLVLRRRERNRQSRKRSRNQFSGRLSDLGATELIEVFGAERKSGILSLFNENGVSGRILFHEGSVTQASVGRQRGEEAVFKMLSWHKGRFTMVFTPVEASSEIGVSNMGLLLQGAKRMEQREELLRHLPALETVLVTTQNFKKIIARKALASDLEYFVSLFDGVHSLGRIIDESKYDEITTLQRILKLYELGFLHVLRDFGPGREVTRAASPAEAPAAAPGASGEEGAESTGRTSAPALDLEQVEQALGAASAEDLLHEEIGAGEAGAPEPAAGEILSPSAEGRASAGLEPRRIMVPGEEAVPAPPVSGAKFAPAEPPAPSEEKAAPPLPPEEKAAPPTPPPEFSRWESDSSYDKDLFYELRHAEEQGQDLFGGSKGEESGLVYPDLERVLPQHPADALLRLEMEEELAESGEPEDAFGGVSSPVGYQEPATVAAGERTPASGETPLEQVRERAEMDELEHTVQLQERFRRAHGTILVLGNNRELGRQMVASLSAEQVQEKGAFQPHDSDLFFGTAEFKGGHLLNLIALSLEREFAPVIDFFAGSLLGFVLLIDGRNVEWGYHRYLRQVLREKTTLPVVVVFAYNEFLQKPLQEQVIRQRLGLRERDGLQLLSDLSVVNSRRIIFRLFQTFYRPRPRSSQAAEPLHSSTLK
ncbi:MAG TPA: response regulator [bacterium]|nr:response regulator [bacterium]HPR86543.1 response regulator [bacterium]